MQQPVEETADYVPTSMGGKTEVRFEAVLLPRLDAHNLTVIATVMAQSVAALER